MSREETTPSVELGIRWMPVRSLASEVIPAQALLAIVGADDDGTYQVNWPSSNSQTGLLVNGATMIAPGEYGQAHNDCPCAVLCDLTGWSPAVGDQCGSETNSWQVHKGQTGYRVGGGDATAGLVNIVAKPEDAGPVADFEVPGIISSTDYFLPVPADTYPVHQFLGAGPKVADAFGVMNNYDAEGAAYTHDSYIPGYNTDEAGPGVFFTAGLNPLPPILQPQEPIYVAENPLCMMLTIDGETSDTGFLGDLYAGNISAGRSLNVFWNAQADVRKLSDGTAPAADFMQIAFGYLDPANSFSLFSYPADSKPPFGFGSYIEEIGTSGNYNVYFQLFGNGLHIINCIYMSGPYAGASGTDSIGNVVKGGITTTLSAIAGVTGTYP